MDPVEQPIPVILICPINAQDQAEHCETRRPQVRRSGRRTKSSLIPRSSASCSDGEVALKHRLGTGITDIGCAERLMGERFERVADFARVILAYAASADLSVQRENLEVQSRARANQ